MLTGDLVRPRLRQRGQRIEIEMLDTTQPIWLRTAEELIYLLHQHHDQSLAIWDNALEAYEGERTDYSVVRGLAKVLSDAVTFSPIATPLPPAELRERLFAHGPVFSTPDLFTPRTRIEVMHQTIPEYSPEQLESYLFADRPAEYRLTDVGPSWTPSDLLARYNLELARGVLYWADRVEVELYDTFKDFWRYLKLFKLMFEARPLADGYRVTLDGPISPFVSATTRYGRQFAAFLPALLLCQRWRMTASVRVWDKDRPLAYQLDHTVPLHSYFKRSGLFDSRLEADFAAEFQERFGDKRGKWQLTREDEVLLLGDTVMIPDFAISHLKDGRRALVEIVGFWHPDYLRRKVAKVRAAQRRNLILLVYQGVNLSAEKLSDVPGEVLYFPNKPVLKDVMAAVERCAE